MLRGFLITLVLAFATSCARGPAQPSPVRLGMVTDVGGLGDHSYNDLAYAGLVAAHGQLGVRIAVIQPESVADFEPMLGMFAAKGFDETFGVGYSVQFDLRETAERFPNRHFSIIDGVIDEPNVTSVTFREEQGSFLAGALAAMTTRTKTIGFLGGADVPLIRKFEAGYVAGAHEIAPHVTVLVKYVGDFNNVPAGAELANILYASGADIIYTAAGKAGLGAIQDVRERTGDFVIGVNSDQDNLVPGKILTSVLKRVDVSVFRIAQLAAAHRPRPRRLVLGLKEGGIGLTSFRYTRSTVTDAMIEKLARLKAAIIDGRIRVPTTRREAERFVPVPL